MVGTFLGLWFVLIVGFAFKASGIWVPYIILEIFDVFLILVSIPGLVLIEPYLPYGHGGQALFQLTVAFLIGSFLISLLVSSLHYSVKSIAPLQEI